MNMLKLIAYFLEFLSNFSKHFHESRKRVSIPFCCLCKRLTCTRVSTEAKRMPTQTFTLWTRTQKKTLKRTKVPTIVETATRV